MLTVSVTLVLILLAGLVAWRSIGHVESAEDVLSTLEPDRWRHRAGTLGTAAAELRDTVTARQRR